MGLDAVVYKNRTNVLIDVPIDHIRVDEDRGEVYIDPETENFSYPRDTFVAYETRLGNVAMIDAIREAALSVISNPNSILLSKVLYSGTHSGDWVPVSDLPRLKDEIEQLSREAHGTREEGLNSFIEEMKRLIAAAEVQGNPLVFV